MLVVNIELWSATTGEKKHLGTAVIANVGGTHSVGEYDVRIGRKGQKEPRSVYLKPWKSASVSGFPRLRLLAWDLLFRGLAAAVGDRNAPKGRA